MIFVGENLYAKVAEQLFGQVWGYSGKNLSHPQKCACSYGLYHRKNEGANVYTCKLSQQKERLFRCSTPRVFEFRA